MRHRVRAVVDRHQPIHRQVGVALGRREARVAQELLDGSQVRPGVEEVRRAGVPEQVACSLLADLVWLSGETVSHQLLNHLEVTVNDYRIIPDLIDLGKVTPAGDRIRVSLASGDRLYKSVIETKESGGGRRL